jgi:uroporphyrin-III C-methyltransferase
MQSSGKVYLIGAGPGDPDLLTVKALRVLRAADVVLYDRLVSPEVLALADPGAAFLYAGKHAGEQEPVQQWIVEQMVAHARRGCTVARLKGGDPCVFGRAGEEWQALRAEGIEVELVPGISSAVAVAGLAGIPVTFRGLSRAFAVVTGHCQDPAETEWSRYAAVDTLVILMGVKHRAAIAGELIRAGRPPEEPAAFIERGTTAEERVVTATLGEIAAGGIQVEAPAVFVVGRVVALRRELTAEALLSAWVPA